MTLLLAYLSGAASGAFGALAYVTAGVLKRAGEERHDKRS